MSKRWIIEPRQNGVDEIARRWGVAPLVAQLLINRGVRDNDQARRFLSPQLRELYPPALLPGATAAAERLAEGIHARRRIVVYGDYDVDGITGTAILWHALTCAGARPTFYVPDRIQEGYGLHVEAIHRLADDGAEMIVSVDCGIGALEAARAARDRGVELIITDHHALPASPAQIPDTIVVHPRIGGTYPNPDLSGSGVAFKVAWALGQRLHRADRVAPEWRELLMACLPLAALGTVADVVPLVDENRILVREGLALMPMTRLTGLRALIESAGLLDAPISGYDVGFKLSPRLNAAGRMGHARLAVELLTRATPERAGEIAAYLERENGRRQTMERRVFDQARELIDHDRLASDSRRGIVVAAEQWHPGVIGIVAARVVEYYERPAILIALGNEEGQGSGRSVPMFDLHEGLQACADHLTSFGGHAMAAGLRIRPENVIRFREAFVDVTNRKLSAADLEPRLRLDACVDLEELSVDVVRSLDRLEPYGAGNPRPRLATDELELAAEPRCVGNGGSHLQAVFRRNGAQIRGIGFGLAGQLENLKQHRRCRVAFEPILNHYQGRTTVEMRMIDLQFPV